jgi:hypothetical protein
MGDRDLATLQSEMKVLDTVRAQEQQGHLSQYLNSLDANSFRTILNACTDYRSSSSVLGDLKLTSDGQLLYSDPASGARESFDLAGHNKVEDLIKGAAGGSNEAQKSLIETLQQWSKDGHHNQDDIDWAMHEYTQQLQAAGKLSGPLRGMQVLGVDGAHDRFLLAAPGQHRYASMDAKSSQFSRHWWCRFWWHGRWAKSVRQIHQDGKRRGRDRRGVGRSGEQGNHARCRFSRNWWRTSLLPHRPSGSSRGNIGRSNRAGRRRRRNRRRRPRSILALLAL